MDTRSFSAKMRSILDSECLAEDGACKEDTCHSLLSRLSRLRRTLNTSALNRPSNDGESLQVDDCTLLKEEQVRCMKDLCLVSKSLVSCFSSESNLVSYAAGKALLALLDYLYEELPLWESVVNFLWRTVKTCFVDNDHTSKRRRYGKDAVDQIEELQLASYHDRTATHMLQVLHTVLRKCNQEKEARCWKFLEISAPWVSEVVSACTASLMEDNLADSRNEEDNLLLATLLRFLCSLNHFATQDLEAINVLQVFTKNSIIESLNTFLAALSQQCLASYQITPLSRYIRYKFLMLMFRLHRWFCKAPCLAITCSQILRSHINTLCHTLFPEGTRIPEPVVISPFAQCLIQSTTAQPWPSSSTLQPERHSVFLIFKVELLSANISSAAKEDSAIKHVASAKGHEDKWILNWLLSQVASAASAMVTLDTEEVANRLALSFLQIFVDEDTLMLEMLLLLLDSSTFQFHPEFAYGIQQPLQRAQEILVALLKPLRLFVVFLSMIYYDHSVLLDFLISKDTSIICLQYLLQCLRMVENTWPELLSLWDASDEDQMKVRQDVVLDINRVMMCLSSLKQAIERLHRKQAFPYNPSPLLKRLDTLQQLLRGEGPLALGSCC